MPSNKQPSFAERCRAMQDAASSSCEISAIVNDEAIRMASRGRALCGASCRQTRTASSLEPAALPTSPFYHAHGIARTHARSRAKSRVSARSTGVAHSLGETEGLEPVMQELPATYHGKENELYFAGGGGR